MNSLGIGLVSYKIILEEVAVDICNAWALQFFEVV